MKQCGGVNGTAEWIDLDKNVSHINRFGRMEEFCDENGEEFRQHDKQSQLMGFS